MNNLKSTIHALQKKDQHIDYVLHWLQSTFYMGESGSLLKATVYKEYSRMCERQGWKATSAAAFGKFVRKAFPNISSNRRGPRGSAKHHYRYLNYIDCQKNRQKQACVIEGDYESNGPDGMEEDKVVTTTHQRVVTTSSSTTTTSPSPSSAAVPAYYDHNSYYNPSVNSKAQSQTNFTQLVMQPQQEQQQAQHPYIKVPRSAGPVAVFEQRRCSLLFPDPSYYAVNATSNNQPLWEETTTTTTTTTTDPLKADDFVSSILADTFGCDSRRNSLLYPFPSSSTQSSNHVDSDDECSSMKKKQQQPQQQQQQHSTTTTPMQMETTPQLKAFKKAYQGYYAAILNAIMFKDDQCVRQEIHAFWVKDFPQHLATVPATPDVREMLLDWDREGMNLLLELLSADARQMGSIEFADSLITVSCYLPIWVQTSAAQVLPKDLLIRQMSLWNLFSQAMYQRAHQMIHALQYPSATTSATPTALCNNNNNNNTSPVCTPLSSSSTPMMAMMNASPETLLGLYRNPNKQSAGYADDGFESEVISPGSVLFLNASA